MKAVLLIALVAVTLISQIDVAEADCAADIAQCTPSMTGDCDGIKKYVDCLMSAGCGEDSTTYQEAKKAAAKCGGVSVTVSSVLTIVMIAAAKFFSG